MLKIRRPLGRLIFNMGIAIPGKTVFLIETAPWLSIVSGNGLLPVWQQAIIWTSADVLSIGPLKTNSTEIWIKILTFTFKKMRLEMSSVRWHPFCPGWDEFTNQLCTITIITPHAWVVRQATTGWPILVRGWFSLITPNLCMDRLNEVTRGHLGSTAHCNMPLWGYSLLLTGEIVSLKWYGNSHHLMLSKQSLPV